MPGKVDPGKQRLWQAALYQVHLAPFRILSCCSWRIHPRLRWARRVWDSPLRWSGPHSKQHGIL